MMLSAETVILASSSRIRRTMLEQAGVPVDIDPARVDEDAVKEAMKLDGAPVEAVAEALAETKAMRVSARHPGRLVIAADQMLECGPVWFDKPPDRDHARAQLQALSGRTHRLVACVVAMRNGTRTWHHTDAAELTMRPLSDSFIDRYLDAMGDQVLTTVGGYQLEGLGAQLFTSVRGDYFTVLGLPLLPLMDHLRNQAVLTP